MARWHTRKVIGAEVAYLLYERKSFGRVGNLLGVFASAETCLNAITPVWPNRHKQRLFAAYENGRLREISQTMELLCKEHDMEAGTI